MNTKIIVTNKSALVRKHGAAGWAKIAKAVKALAAADAKRGFSTQLVLIDDAKQMKELGGARVTKAKDPRQAKKAIDAACRALAPAYVVLLGAGDVIPHQALDNPLWTGDPEDDPDEKVDSDLPYACDAPYSTEIRRLLGPCRVIGRLPDLPGSKKPDHLLALLAVATKWTSRPASDYRDCFALTAREWTKSTAMSVKRTFAPGQTILDSPTRGPKWKTETKARAHFVNCHGDMVEREFCGQEGEDYPVAHDPSLLPGRIMAGTIATAECCYGAQLHDPGGDASARICHVYMREGSYGFFGATTVAYGPASGNGSADLVCQYFHQAILAGASLGRATLEARQRFIKKVAPMDPTDLKTLAQFILLGDPSVHPVKAAAAPKPKGTSLAKARMVAKAPAAASAARDVRRGKLAVSGAVLRASKCAVGSSPTRSTSALPKAMSVELNRSKLGHGKTLVYEIERPAPVSASERSVATMSKAFVSAAKAPDEVAASYHVVFVRKAGSRIPKSAKGRRSAEGRSRRRASRTVLVVLEEAGKFTGIWRLDQH